MQTGTQRIRLSNSGLGIVIISYLLVIFSYPMPPKIGVVEVIMGTGLTIGSLLLGFTLVMREGKNLKLFVLCVSYFLLAPLLVGVLHSNNPSNVVRDVAPLMFMVVIPLLIILLPQDRNTPYRLRALLLAILTVGLVSAIQFHYGILQIFGTMSGYVSRYGTVIPDSVLDKFVSFILRSFMLIFKNIEYTYNDDFQMLMVKCQDPAILFSAIYLLCLGLTFILVKPRRLSFGLLALSGGWLCVYEFTALGMRAFSGLTVLSLIIYVIYLTKLKRIPKSNLIVAGILGLSLTYTQVVNFAAQLWAKHQAAGLSSRPEELYAVFGAISESFITLLFGVGWGGLLINPIYQGSTSRFTHSLISYWLLKTGVVGVAVMVLFVTLLFRRVNLGDVWASSHRLAVFLAASSVIIIGLFFEPTYKMLSFGLIVGLLLAELSSPSEPDRKRMPDNNSLQPHADKL